jgi:flagellar protein FlaG
MAVNDTKLESVPTLLLNEKATNPLQNSNTSGEVKGTESTDLSKVEESSALVSEDEVREKVADLNQYMQNLNRSLQFSVDEGSGQTVIQVIDSETQELVRQIPSQELIDVKNTLEEFRGLIFKDSV